MLINEVEHLVGLSKKSIRYYEEHGLLRPKRNRGNDYRIYDEEDVKKLKLIKFLRELGVPIRELKLLEEEKLTLQECIKDRIHKIEQEEENYKKVKSMCMEIEEKKHSFHDIDISTYFEKMNVINKEGFTMRDRNTDKKKKIWGAVLSSLVFGLIFIFLMGIMIYFQITEEEKCPWILFYFINMIFLIPLFGIGINLINRIKEIKKGEEDEASQY